MWNWKKPDCDEADLIWTIWICTAASQNYLLYSLVSKSVRPEEEEGPPQPPATPLDSTRLQPVDSVANNCVRTDINHISKQNSLPLYLFISHNGDMFLLIFSEKVCFIGSMLKLIQINACSLDFNVTCYRNFSTDIVIIIDLHAKAGLLPSQIVCKL